jgi:hypothetical protein
MLQGLPLSKELGSLRKILNILLIYFGHLLRLHLGLLLCLLGYYDRALGLRSCMMQVRKCLCEKVHWMK